jgi:hypothetical protein
VAASKSTFAPQLSTRANNAEGSKSEKRREDVIGTAVHVMRMPRV